MVIFRLLVLLLVEDVKKISMGVILFSECFFKTFKDISVEENRMKREKMFKGCLLAALLAVVGFAMPAFAGSLEPPASAVDGGGNPVSTMRNMDELLSSWIKLLADS